METTPTPSPGKPAAASILPHEWCFGAFLALTWLRLAFTGGQALAWSSVSWLFGGECGHHSLGAAKARRASLAGAPAVYPAAMGICFYTMAKAVPLLGIPQRDDWLLAWDRALLGETPALAWAALAKPWFVDLAMAGYLFFFYYLIAGPGRYCIRDLALFRKCIVGLFVLYGIGFIGYTVLPAGGPHRFMEFPEPLRGLWLWEATIKAVNDGSNRVDAFPSLHFAATLYLLLFDWQHARRRFWVLLGPCLLLWFATMFLRFHYFVDLVGGAIIAGMGWFVAERFARKWQETAGNRA